MGWIKWLTVPSCGRKVRAIDFYKAAFTRRPILRRSFVKAYVITSGTIFSLIVAVHIWRVAVEGPALAKDPIWILTTVAVAALSIWAWRVLRALPKT